MAPLTTKQRNALPDSAFAIPSERAYPVNDKARRANALARVAQFGSAKEKSKVHKAVMAKAVGSELERYRARAKG